MKPAYVVLVLMVVLLLSSCANVEQIEKCLDFGMRRGFFWGLLHGFLAPLTFIISIFSDTVAMYAVNNTGVWYDAGFLLGLGGFSGGIFKSRKK